MLESFLITFRETLEAALIVFIILSYLKKTGNEKESKIVLFGVISAVAISLLSAWIFTVLAGGFTGVVEEIFEGTVMVLAAVLLTTMIIWMAKAKHVRHQIESKVQVELSDKHKIGLFSVVFLSVLREGIETVIFLGAITMRGAENSMPGAMLGILIAVIIGYGLFYGTKKLHIKTFFRVTSVLLIFFAAGLLAHGIHEFQEAGVIPFLTATAWNINPAQLADGSYPLLHEEGAIGSILKGVLGYNGNPTVLEVITYFAYLVLAFYTYRRIGLQK